MRLYHRQFGLTLPEMTVVIAIAALLVGLTLPAARMLFKAFESESGTKTMISAALASARAIAAKEQRYAGIRFQKRYAPNNPDPLNAPQYMIFIIHDVDGTKLANGFRAVEGLEPMKLPDSIGVMDFLYNPSLGGATPDASFANPNVVRDTTTFSIVFSPSGKLLIHDVQVRNRNGIPDSASQVGNTSYDDIFNKKIRVDAGYAMFYQDDYFNPTWSAYPGLNLGLGPENSRNRFYIYETNPFKQAYKAGNAWSNYLFRLKPVYINAYTGTIVEQ